MSQNKNAGSLHLYRSDGTVRLPVAGKFNPQINSHCLFRRTWSTPRTGSYLAASLGFEPRQRDSESLVLPLHYEATSEQNKDRCASLQVAQLPSRMNLRGGDLLCFEQDFGAFLSPCHFQIASALYHEFASGFHHGVYHLVVVTRIMVKQQ